MSTSSSKTDRSSLRKHWWIYITLALPLCIFIIAVIMNGNTTPFPSDIEDVRGYLRGDRMAYIRQFASGSAIEDISVAETGWAVRGPVADPTLFPPPKYTRQSLQSETFQSFTAVVDLWCQNPPRVAVDRTGNYLSIGIRCGRLRTTLVKIMETDVPPALLDVLQEIPPP